MRRLLSIALWEGLDSLESDQCENSEKCKSQRRRRHSRQKEKKGSRLQFPGMERIYSSQWPDSGEKWKLEAKQKSLTSNRELDNMKPMCGSYMKSANHAVRSWPYGSSLQPLMYACHRAYPHLGPLHHATLSIKFEVPRERIAKIHKRKPDTGHATVFPQEIMRFERRSTSRDVYTSADFAPMQPALGMTKSTRAPGRHSGPSSAYGAEWPTEGLSRCQY
jgi:hypothetical protein